MSKLRETASSSIIMVDDEPEALLSYQVLLESAGLAGVVAFQDSRHLLPFLADNGADIVVLDLQMPHISGKELLQEIVSNYPYISVIVITAAAEIDTAVSCMKIGAFEYLEKPVDANRFLSCINKGLEVTALRREIHAIRESVANHTIQDEDAFAAINTRNARMRVIFGYLEGVATTSQPVIICGETGVGKELVARALHHLSGRHGDFVAVNVAGLDDMLLADTLFGHRVGAFTGAAQSREGMVSKASEGTLFLDEIGDLSLPSQIKLLRLIQEGQFHPLGSDEALCSSARIVVATNSDLRKMIGTGSFRKDLYYRLCAHEVHLPSLRERSEDIPILLEYFLKEASQVFGKKLPAYPPDLINYLSAYHFPGNVRELRGMVFDALARHKGGVLSMAAFREAIGREVAANTTTAWENPDGDQLLKLWGRFPTFKEMEKCLVTEALKLSNDNQGAAAALLGISRQALNKRAKCK
jgi:DNA-binding NtrC family response regulator